MQRTNTNVSNYVLYIGEAPSIHISKPLEHAGFWSMRSSEAPPQPNREY